MPFSFDEVPSIHLSDLMTRHDGLTPAFGAALAEAATVCLESASHSSGVSLQLSGMMDHACKVLWEQMHPEAPQSWNDHEQTTEWGAYAVAISLAASALRLHVKERSRKGTRFDFFLGRRDRDTVLVQDTDIRLEVSGIRSGSHPDIEARVAAKLKRFRTVSAHHLFVIVVEFSSPHSRVMSYGELHA